ncbi:MAG TPA: glutathione synthase [Myxococcota bacterium]|jgi:glutathione synthase
MRHLFVMDPIESVHPDKDTTFAFMADTQARGHDNLVCGLHDLWAEDARGFARADRVEVHPSTSSAGRDKPAHFTRRDRVDIAFSDVDIIWMRKDPPVDDAYLYATMILDRAPCLVLNDPISLRVVHEKMWGLWAEEVTPRQVVSSRPDILVEFVKKRGKGVLKPLHMMGGMGVFAFDADDKNLRSAADLLTFEGKRQALAQEYLPAVRQGDKRVILIDGEPVGAVLRVPRGDDHRSNMHVGGTAAKAVVDDDDRRICALIGPKLRELGLFFVGIDVIGGKLTEVNVTSPTGVQEINKLDARTGGDRLEALVVDAALAKLAARRRTPG